MEYEIISLEERFDLFQAQDGLCDEAWPEFMMHDPVTKEWMTFIQGYKEYQLLMMEGEEILGIINTIPVKFNSADAEGLPEEGWDAGFLSGLKCLKEGTEPTMLMGVQIVINKKYQGCGLSLPAVKEMAALARRKGFKDLVIPVRPSEKHKFPLIPMEEYLSWEKEPGLPYDGWLRGHVRAGGEIVNICPRAMYIPGTIEEWETWTGLEIPGSGSYVVPGALNPVEMDVEKDLGVYGEPNVWVRHRV
ncbi:MAG: hypothetical protein PQJ59_03240 [Spirochaetales bacterium]|nr:hypothetical protein [Spirochaetales bacterium]